MSPECSSGEFSKLLIGWALGLGSAILMELYKKDEQSDRFRSAVKTEISELQLTIAGALISLNLSKTKVTRTDIEECRDLQNRYSIGIDIPSIKTTIDKLLSLTFVDFELAAKEYAKTKFGTAQVVPALHLPYLSSSPSSISLLDESEQKALVKSLVLIERVNGKVVDMNYWLRETFKVGLDQKRVNMNYDSSRDALVSSMRELLKITESIPFES